MSTRDTTASCGWTRFPNDLIARVGELGRATFAVYAVIAMHARVDKPEAWPSVAKLANITKLSERSVRRAIERLASEGCVEVVVRRDEAGASLSNLYRLLNPPLEQADTTAPQCPECQGEGGCGVSPRGSVVSGGGGHYSTPKKNKEKKNKEEEQRKNKQRSASQPPQGLLALIDGWNGLPEGIVTQKARRDQPAKELLAGWNRLAKDTDAHELLTDVPAILDAIRDAEFCHGQGWFTLAWLFGRNRSGELKLERLLNGGYRQKERNEQGRTRPLGDGYVYNPNAVGSF